MSKRDRCDQYPHQPIGQRGQVTRIAGQDDPRRCRTATATTDASTKSSEPHTGANQQVSIWHATLPGGVGDRDSSLSSEEGIDHLIVGAAAIVGLLPGFRD